MYQNHHGALEVLSAKDPLLLPSRLVDGRTVSHIAAAHADARTFHVLANKADLSLITVDDVDNDGRSFQEVFEASDLVTEELRTAFKQFCSKVVMENSCPVLTDPVDSEDEFVDALEEQVGEFPAIT